MSAWCSVTIGEAYVCTSVNVGDVIGSVTPSARPNPWANAVLPAPISPANTITSPARLTPASAAAIAWVASSDGACSVRRVDGGM